MKGVYMTIQKQQEPRWKELFRISTLLRTKVASQNPVRGIALTDKNGPLQVNRWDVSTGILEQANDLEHGTLSGWISPDGNWIYYMNDSDGSELGHLVRVPYEGGEIQDLTPDMEPYTLYEIYINNDCSKIYFIAAQKSGFNLYTVTLEDSEPGEPEFCFTDEREMFNLTGTPSGDRTVVCTFAGDAMEDTVVNVLDSMSGKPISQYRPAYNAWAYRHSPCENDPRILIHSDETGVLRPELWNYQTNEITGINPLGLEGELSICDWSEDGDEILLFLTKNAVKQLYSYNLKTEAVTKVNHEGGTVCYFFFDDCYYVGDEIYVQWQSSNEATQVLAFDRNTGTYLRQILALAEPHNLPKWRSFTYASSDGEEIQGWVVTPEGEGPFPTILHTHGGPHWVQPEEFSPNSQMWVENGFAYSTINFRGSTTFGKEFCKKIHGNLGHWEIEDIVAARQWLIDQGIAHEEQVIPAGGSYGGYNTLMALSKYPNLWAGGLATAAIADWQKNYEDSSESLKAAFDYWFGGKDDEFYDRMEKSSPSNYMENVTKPILIIQGRSDSRTPARQVAEYEVAMKALGNDITVHWYDSGHFGSDKDEDIAHAELKLEYAKRFIEVL